MDNHYIRELTTEINLLRLAVEESNKLNKALLDLHTEIKNAPQYIPPMPPIPLYPYYYPNPTWPFPVTPIDFGPDAEGTAGDPK